MAKTKIGVVFGAGSVRGISHIGVIKVLQQIGIKPYCITGSSIGAIVGAAYALGIIPKKMENLAKSMNIFELVKLTDITFPKDGLIKGNKIEKFIESFINDFRFEDTKIPFACTATDINSGEKVILNSGLLRNAVRASISIPGLFKPVKINGRLLVDGGLVDPVPVDVAYSMGAEKVIAISLFSERLFRSDRKEDSIKNKYVIPRIYKILYNSFYIMMNKIEKDCINNATILITPQLDGIGFRDFYKAAEIIKRGESATLKLKERIEKLI